MSGELSNIARYLPEMAARQPDALAIALPVGDLPNGGVKYRRVSYAELDRQSDEVAHALVAAGIERGMATALMVKPGPDFFALTFAMAKMGAVPVVIDPGIGLANIKTCLAEARPEAFIGIQTAQAARWVLGWARSSLRKLVTVGGRAWFGGISLQQAKQRAGEGRGPFPIADTRSDETAAILFTSGSTGVPKGAVYTHGNFAAQVETLRRISGVEPGEIDLPTLPVFALFDPALGMSTIVPDMDPTRPASVDPRRLVSAIEQFGVTNMFASPAVLNVMARYGTAHDVKLPTLRRVVCAGAPVQPAIMEQFLSMLGPDARIVTPYGATEALPVCVVDSREILQPDVRERTASGAGVLLGRPLDEVKLSIIRIDDGPIESWSAELLVQPGEVGEIVVEGPMVTATYRNRESSTKLAKIRTPGGIAHRMGDLGYLDEQGRLWFCGRKSHRVETPGGTLYPVPCEMIFNVHPSVYRTALVGVQQTGDNHPVLCVELQPEARDVHQGKVRDELLALGAAHGMTRRISQILFHSGFPVDIRHNAKIDRPQLGRWALGRAGPGRGTR